MEDKKALLSSKELYNVLNAFKIFIDGKFEEEIPQIKNSTISRQEKKALINYSHYMRAKTYDLIGSFMVNSFTCDDIFENQLQILSDFINPMRIYSYQVYKINVENVILEKMRELIDKIREEQI